MSEIPVVIPGHQVSLDRYFGSGIQPGEEPLPEAEERKPEISVNADTLAALESMGFPTSKCHKAIRETGDSGVESATSWLFEHMDDVEVDEPAPAAQVSLNEEHVAMLMDMGFTANQAKKALGETDGNVERAVEWLFSHPDDDGTVTSHGTTAQDAQPAASARTERTGPSHGDTALPATFKLKSFISHKGPSVFSGHYVAHIHSHHLPSILMPSSSSSSPPEKKNHWVLFNDEKVAVAEQGALSYETMAPFAYIYLFERSEQKN
ncbi:hypothetical protein PCANC_22300 [Puccinia coronata f. sp. avenae]|uniref:Ubiquitin carboxyl-terminal hydrolase 14 n=1 Tax=Puccinia coronata f. sp. avenae TaxID=200324 RepID=A0A2N5TRU7_9BASI|nr:hypothetical protein PCANC_22300 [Puccinia coronata f. sp. avenae]